MPKFRYFIRFPNSEHQSFRDGSDSQHLADVYKPEDVAYEALGLEREMLFAGKPVLVHVLDKQEKKLHRFEFSMTRHDIEESLLPEGNGAPPDVPTKEWVDNHPWLAPLDIKEESKGNGMVIDQRDMPNLTEKPYKHERDAAGKKRYHCEAKGLPGFLVYVYPNESVVAAYFKYLREGEPKFEELIEEALTMSSPKDILEVFATDLDTGEKKTHVTPYPPHTTAR